MNDHAAPVPSPSHPSERLHALDALRAVAMMLGVWLHAALPFVEGLPPFYWPFVEEPQSAPIGLSVVVIHAWRMETFFLLSGFFTALLIARRGGLATLRQRSLRVLVPFLIALAVIQPLCVLVWSWGYAMQWGWPLGETFESVFKNSWGVDTPGAEGRFGRLYHLWFIYELCVLIGVGLLARWVVMSLLPGPVQRALVAGWAGLSRATAWCVGSWLGAVVLAVPVGAALLLHHPTGAAPNESLAPQWPALVYHALPFFAGWALYAARGVVDRLARRWWAPAAVGVLATLVHLRAMGRSRPSSRARTPRRPGWRRPRRTP